MTGQARDYRVQMSFDTLLERKINAVTRVFWMVNNFKGLELKCVFLKASQERACYDMLCNN